MHEPLGNVFGALVATQSGSSLCFTDDYAAIHHSAYVYFDGASVIAIGRAAPRRGARPADRRDDPGRAQGRADGRTSGRDGSCEPLTDVTAAVMRAQRRRFRNLAYLPLVAGIPLRAWALDLRGRLQAGEELGLLRGELLVGQDAALVQIAEPFEGRQHRIGVVPAGDARSGGAAGGGGAAVRPAGPVGCAGAGRAAGAGSAAGPGAGGVVWAGLTNGRLSTVNVPYWLVNDSLPGSPPCCCCTPPMTWPSVS